MIHHHHFYDENEKPAYLSHDHDYDSIVHLTELPSGSVSIYWDHQDVDLFNCDRTKPVRKEVADPRYDPANRHKNTEW